MGNKVAKWIFYMI